MSTHPSSLDTSVLIPIILCGGLDCYTLISRQSRVAIDTCFAGVITGLIHDDLFQGALATEIQKETGILFQESELIRINESPIFLSSDPSAEGLVFYAAVRRLEREKIEQLDKQYGKRLKLIDIYRLPQETATDGKSLIAWHLLKPRLADIRRQFENKERAAVLANFQQRCKRVPYSEFKALAADSEWVERKLDALVAEDQIQPDERSLYAPILSNGILIARALGDPSLIDEFMELPGSVQKSLESLLDFSQQSDSSFRLSGIIAREWLEERGSETSS